MNPLRVRLTPQPHLRVLDWDLENRPLAYLGPDFTTGEVTAIAASWVPGTTDVRLLGEVTLPEMLQWFVSLYDQADLVTGHYILGHDLPVVNGALLEQGMAPLKPKWVSDTKVHLVKRRYISASQEALAGMFGLAQEKDHMSNPLWREANRLTPAGLELTRSRVVHDVEQHKALRAHLIQLGALKSPTLWKP